ncbi:hypothetical protein [Pseudoalteromonas denitrificans]|uniref:Uncharacterized protein n=1 Tax=Pseudoalteromonas denitrificans DSM 6059 TaxID=1123010 RepID=A0A1I1FPN2_9GAMM|nr:hypothetical protein [Pseudoalteromonas denitrificans]SFB99053.1 hypothetical protein SAMN02745724_00648 [Pseudoalteromonas denitrificans DSM 6059]
MNLKIITIILFVISTISYAETKIQEDELKPQASKIKSVIKKPARTFSLTAKNTDKKEAKPKEPNSNRKFIPTESISEDLSVSFPVDI